jgi:hypothetical protein
LLNLNDLELLNIQEIRLSLVFIRLFGHIMCKIKSRKNILILVLISINLAFYLRSYQLAKKKSDLILYNTTADNTSAIAFEIKTKQYNIKRKTCLMKIDEEIRNEFKKIIPSGKTVHVMGIPELGNHGDTFIWLDEKIIKTLTS